MKFSVSPYFLFFLWGLCGSQAMTIVATTPPPPTRPPPTLPPPTRPPPTRPPPTRPPTTVPPTRPTIALGCYDGLKLYPVGAKVMEGLCPKYCRAGGKWQYIDTFECIFGYKSTTSPKTTVPKTTVPKTTVPFGCFYRLRWYTHGDVIRYVACEVKFCDHGNVRSIRLPCTTPPPPTTTTRSMNCFFNNKWYRNGDSIPSRGCAYKYCHFGDVRTVFLPCTRPPTTVPPTLSSSKTDGCFYNGRWYKPWEQVGRGDCWGSYCHPHSNMVTRWDSCGKTTPYPKHPTTMPLGCFENGRWYAPGAEISRGQTGNWCYGTTCSKGGVIRSWDNFNCVSTPLPPTTIPYSTQRPKTRPPTTKLPQTTPLGCYTNGRWYAPGEEVSRGQSGSWCYGSFCSENGVVLHWDNFKCTSTTPPPKTTSPATPPPPSTTTRPPTTTCGGNCQLYCYKDGRLFPKGKEMSRRTTFSPNGQTICYGSYCGDNGKEVFWKDPTCGKTTPITPSPPIMTTTMRPRYDPPLK